MNFFYRTPCLKVRRNVSYSQINYFRNTPKYSVATRAAGYSSVFHRQQLFVNANKPYNYIRCYVHNDSENIDHDLDETGGMTELWLYDEMQQYQSVRNLLHPNSNDSLIIKLNDCSSVQEVLDLIRDNSDKLQSEHTAQAILVLWDLQKMFLYAHQINESTDDMQSDTKMHSYVSQLVNHSEFNRLLEVIQVKCEDFSVESLSCILLYLNKMGLSIKHDVLQLLVERLRRCLVSDISLSALSRFIVAVFSEQNLGSFFIVQDTLPIIAERLDKCETVEELKLITICLNRLQYLVTNDLLQKYKDKVQELTNSGLISSDNYRTVLKIIMVLSHPRWNYKNTIQISQLMLLLKNKLHMLRVSDFFIVYEVLYKNHEPGELLTEMQRCASRLLVHLEEETSLPTDVRLKLLLCIMCFSSPLHRPDYEKIIAKRLESSLTESSLFDLLRILTFIKPSDSKISKTFWDNVLKTVTTKQIFRDHDLLLKLCHNYMNFNNDVHYRHKKFEQQMIKWLCEEFENGIMHLIPNKMSTAAAFIIAFGSDTQMINFITEKIAENWQQFNHVDCLYLSKGLRNVTEATKNPAVNQEAINSINSALNKCIIQKLAVIEDVTKVNFLLKSCVYRKCFHKELLEKLLLLFRADQELSSNAIRNTVFCLQTTNALLPDVIDSIAEYVLQYRDNLLGFNAEKVAYLCYFLGYLPRKSDELFQAITDVIIRDQERISGLSYIQAALSLCFFHKLPDSFIKQIFNVTFLDKLDTELAACYFKDTYPLRVRHSMMQLNRAVCLDYPQFNVPWFHQNYIEQLLSKAREKTKETNIVSKVKPYLLKLVENQDYLLQSVNTAYGYHADFVIELDSNARLTKPNSSQDGTKIAILLMRPSAYTIINMQLKGQYQLKKRHLEILGYKVLKVNLNEWDMIVSGEEKMEYLNKLIWPASDLRQKQFVIER